MKSNFCPWEVVCEVDDSWDYRVEKLTGNVYIYHNRVILDVYSIEVLSPLFNENGTPVTRAQLIELLAFQGINRI